MNDWSNWQRTNRILLVMARDREDFTAFEINLGVMESRTKKRILYLADRNILIDQTKTNDFKPVRYSNDQDWKTEM